MENILLTAETTYLSLTTAVKRFADFLHPLPDDDMQRYGCAQFAMNELLIAAANRLITPRYQLTREPIPHEQLDHLLQFPDSCVLSIGDLNTVFVDREIRFLVVDNALQSTQTKSEDSPNIDDEKASTQRNQKELERLKEITPRPWLAENPADSPPNYAWYAPARYFAREILKEKPQLKLKRGLLSAEISKRMLANKIFNRGKLKAYDPGTILKALVGCSFKDTLQNPDIQRDAGTLNGNETNQPCHHRI